MVAPLDLIEFYLPPTGDSNILLQDTNGNFTVGQVFVEINGPVVDFLEDFGLIWHPKALPEEGYMEHVVEIGQLLRQLQL